jgi:hypothetical protein
VTQNMREIAPPSRSSAGPIDRAQDSVEDFSRSKAFEWWARAGLVARGVIYAVIGILAIKLALGDGGKTTNQNGALETIVKQPFGKVLLIVLAVGLAGYATWRLARAALGHGVESSDDTKERLDGLVSGLGYAALFVAAVSILLGSDSGSGSPDKATGGVLDWPAGQVLVAIAGLIVIGVGLEQGYKGIKRTFLEKSKTEEMNEGVERTFTGLGIFGHLARMVVFTLIGYFFIRAAIDYNPDKAVSLDGALAALGQASYGPVLLGAVAAGLIGFAAYSIADARYRRV